MWQIMSHDKEKFNCGYHETEIEAAYAVNEKCHELGIPLRNPEVGLANASNDDVSCYILSFSITM